MSWISKLKDRSYYIDFDSGYVYDENDSVVAEITSPTQFNILLYFADHPGMWLKKDGIISTCWPDSASAEYVSDSTFYKQIHGVKHIHVKVSESIESSRGMGYKYHGLRKEKKDSSPQKLPPEAAPRSSPSGKKTNVIPSSVENVISLSSMLIHKGGQDHPELGAELELMIRNIIGILEQGVAEDFESVSDRAWEDYSLKEKAAKIFRAYENIMERSRTLSPDPNAKL